MTGEMKANLGSPKNVATVFQKGWKIGIRLLLIYYFLNVCKF